MGQSTSKPSTIIPSLSISVKPIGPTISSIPLDFPHSATASSNILHTALSSTKSNQPNRILFSFQMELDFVLIIPTILPTALSPLYAMKILYSQNSKAGFFLLSKVVFSSIIKGGTHILSSLNKSYGNCRKR